MTNNLPTSHRLGRWLESFRISDDPFALYEADLEHDNLPSMYVDRPYLHSIFGDPGHPQTALLRSGKGDGKTATREMVAYNCLKGKTGQLCLPIRYTDFSYTLAQAETPQKITVKHHVAAIVRRALFELINADIPICFDLLPEFDASILLGYASEFADTVTFLRLKNNFKNLEPALLKWENLTASEFLSGFANLINLLGPSANSRYQSMYILVDRVDETSAGPEAAIDILKPLVAEGPLLNLRKVAFKFFLSERIEEKLIPLMATTPDRIRRDKITWDGSSLRKIIDQRLVFYSKGRVTRLEELCSPAIKYTIGDRLLEACDNSPRTLLRLCRLLIHSHVNRIDSTTSLLERLDLVDALQALQHENELTQAGSAQTDNETLKDNDKLLQPTQDLFLDKGGHLWINNERLQISLPEMEYRLLEVLYKVSPKIISEPELIAVLWPAGESGETNHSLKKTRNNLRKLIGRLRDNLAQVTHSDKDRFIKNERSRGYWLSKK